jgi:hypothetical protein
MSKDMIFTLIAAMFYVAIIFMLVRPSSKGPTIVNNVFNAFSDLIRGSVGYTYDSSTGKWAAP